MLLMVKKGIRGGICHAMQIINILKIIVKHHVIISREFRWKQFVCVGMSQKLLGNSFNWVKKLSQFGEC